MKPLPPAQLLASSEAGGGGGSTAHTLLQMYHLITPNEDHCSYYSVVHHSGSEAARHDSGFFRAGALPEFVLRATATNYRVAEDTLFIQARALGVYQCL